MTTDIVPTPPVPERLNRDHIEATPTETPAPAEVTSTAVSDRQGVDDGGSDNPTARLRAKLHRGGFALTIGTWMICIYGLTSGVFTVALALTFCGLNAAFWVLYVLLTLTIRVTTASFDPAPSPTTSSYYTPTTVAYQPDPPPRRTIEPRRTPPREAPAIDRGATPLTSNPRTPAVDTSGAGRGLPTGPRALPSAADRTSHAKSRRAALPPAGRDRGDRS